MLTAPVLAVYNRTEQTVIPKSIIPDPECYDLNPRVRTEDYYYESRLKGLSQETTLILSNTRKLNRVPNTK